MKITTTYEKNSFPKWFLKVFISGLKGAQLHFFLGGMAPGG